MPLPTIPDTFRVAVKWSNSDLLTSAVNVMHFTKSGGDPADLATKIAAHVAAGMWAATSVNSKIVELDITPLDGSSATYNFATDGTAKWAGQDSATDVNPAVAFILKLRTAKRGRSYRGRLFLPWVSEGKQTNGRLVAGVVTGAQTAWNTFFAAMTSDGWHMAVASYKLSTAEPCTALLVETYVATQQRRLKRNSL